MLTHYLPLTGVKCRLALGSDEQKLQKAFALAIASGDTCPECRLGFKAKFPQMARNAAQNPAGFAERHGL